MKPQSSTQSETARNRLYRFRDELVTAGFSVRVANALAFGSGITTLRELTDRKWGERNIPGDLLHQLSSTPKLGVVGIAEIMAFREARRPLDMVSHGPVVLTLRLSPEEQSALDAWAKARGRAVKRPDAALELIREGLGLGAKPKPTP